MGSRWNAPYSAMVAMFALAAALGLAGVFTAFVWDPNGNTSEWRRETDGASRPDDDPNRSGVDGMLFPEGSPVTGDGTLPTGTAWPQSPTDTDRASGPAARDGTNQTAEPPSGNELPTR